MKRGFTILELLTVVAVVIGLAAISVRVYTLISKRAAQAACVNNLHQLGVSLENYLQDNNGEMPSLAAGRADKASDEPVLETVLAEYVSSTEVFHCPADKELFEKSGSSYIWNTALNGQNRFDLKFLDGSDKVTSVPLIFDKGDFHASGVGVNILYGDYSVSDRVTFNVRRDSD